MTPQDRKKIYEALSAPFPEEAIERTEGRVTGRGYDTTGIKYQYVVNRLNEVLGVGGYRTQQTVTVRQSTNAKGRTMFDATCELTLQLGEWVGGQFHPFAEAYGVGGHTSMNESDARKGSVTNSIKKAAAMLGCGKQAYEGTLDDDNVPADMPREDGHDARSEFQPRPSTPDRSASTGANQVRTNQNGAGNHHQQQSTSARNRLTSKQLGALMTISRKLGYEPGKFRDEVKRRFGVLPDFLDSRTASNLIGELTARASNGHSHPMGRGVEA